MDVRRRHEDCTIPCTCVYPTIQTNGSVGIFQLKLAPGNKRAELRYRTHAFHHSFAQQFTSFVKSSANALREHALSVARLSPT